MADFNTPSTAKTSDDPGLVENEKNLFITDLGGALAGNTSKTLKDVEDETATAQGAADAAQSTADTAETKADNAQGTADTAEAKADAAQGTADTALSTAEAAMIREARFLSQSPPTNAVTLDYAERDHYEITGRQSDVEFTPINVPTGQNVKLTVVKDADVNITWGGAVVGTIDGKVLGATTVRFELVNFNGSILAVQTNRQFTENVGIGDITVTSGLNQLPVNSVSIARWDINNNVATFNVVMNITFDGTVNSFSVSVGGLSHGSLDNAFAASSFMLADISSSFGSGGVYGSVALFVKTINNIGVGAKDVYISGSYRID